MILGETERANVSFCNFPSVSPYLIRRHDFTRVVGEEQKVSILEPTSPLSRLAIGGKQPLWFTLRQD